MRKNFEFPLFVIFQYFFLVQTATVKLSVPSYFWLSITSGAVNYQRLAQMLPPKIRWGAKTAANNMLRSIFQTKRSPERCHEITNTMTVRRHGTFIVDHKAIFPKCSGQPRHSSGYNSKNQGKTSDFEGHN